MREPTVIFATDLEGDVMQGLGVASQLAAERCATLVVAHVMPLRTADGEGMLHDCVELMSRERDRARAVRGLSPPDDASVAHRSHLLVGDPEDALARIASEPNVELLVMEARPRGPVKRLFGKSLIDRLGERIECPIVTYRARSASVRKPLMGPRTALAPSLALQIVLDARVDALLDWMDRRLHAATTIAGRRSVHYGVASLVAARHDGPLERRVRDELSLELHEHLRGTQAAGIELWVGPSRILCLGRRSESGPERDAWMTEVMREGAAVSLPIEGGEGQSPVILAGARIPLSAERSAVLVLTFDARRGFLRILAQPGPTLSAETYAFDERGVMLSDSRFAEQLRQVGLLPFASQTIGRVRVSDPGASLLDTRPHTDVDGWPLTHMAAAAVAGNDGVNTRGYRDYRGVPVIGAWRWIESLHFGVAAEMDVSDAQVAHL